MRWRIEPVTGALPFSHGLWIAALVSLLPGVDPMYCLLTQLLIIAAWGDSDAETSCQRTS